MINQDKCVLTTIRVIHPMNSKENRGENNQGKNYMSIITVLSPVHFMLFIGRQLCRQRAAGPGHRRVLRGGGQCRAACAASTSCCTWTRITVIICTQIQIQHQISSAHFFWYWLGRCSAFHLSTEKSVSDISEPRGSPPRSASSSSAIARTWWLSTPQQPPMTRTPSSYAARANLAASQRVIWRGSSAAEEELWRLNITPHLRSP